MSPLKNYSTPLQQGPFFIFFYFFLFFFPRKLFATWQLKKIQGGDDSYKGFFGEKQMGTKVAKFQGNFLFGNLHIY
jgi:hypothetical protein